MHFAYYMEKVEHVKQPIFQKTFSGNITGVLVTTQFPSVWFKHVSLISKQIKNL